MGAGFLSGILGAGKAAELGTFSQGIGQALRTYALGASAPAGATQWQLVGERLGQLLATPQTFMASRLLGTPMPPLPPLEQRSWTATGARKKQGP